jgi:hypothetical protein
LVLVGVSLVLTVTLSASAAQRHANATPAEKAEACIRAALRKEDLAIKYIKEGRLGHLAVRGDAIYPAMDDLECAINAARAAGALDEITRAESLKVREGLNLAHRADFNANFELYPRNDRKASIAELELAGSHKTQALAALEKATALPPPAPVATDSLTSPAGSGPIQVTDVKCYLNGTGGNAERDAGFSVDGVSWHLQQVFPSSYVSGGSATTPMVFIEDMAAPYNEPGVHIYAAFGVTVSGDIGTISSGQQVSVNSSLVDPQGNPITPSHLTISFKCP